MKTGFSKKCINPKNGVPMLGYYERRRAKGVLDDIFAEALALDDGKSKALIISVDLCLLSTEQCDGLRKKIHLATGVAENAIFINCSHTHTAPTYGYEKISNLAGSDEYNAFFEEALCDVAREALCDMRDSEFYFSKASAENLAFCRRFRMKDGSVKTNPGVNNPDIDYPLGTPDETVKLLKITRSGAFDILVFSFGMHADTVGGEFISGDWPALARHTLEKALDNTHCLFLLGSEGDVAHVNVNPTPADRIGLRYDSFDGVPRGYSHAYHIGRKVAGTVLGMIDKAEPVKADTLSFGTRTIFIPSNQENDRLEEAEKIRFLYENGRAHELPYKDMELTTAVAEAVRICELKNGPDGFEFRLSALKIGDFILAGLPGECFADIGREIEALRSEKILVSCLTNGGDSYFPTSSAYDEGGYEAKTSRLKKGGDKIIAKEMSALIREISIL